MIELVTLALHLGSAVALDWERVAFPAGDVFARLQNESCYRGEASRAECVTMLDALARAASGGREFLRTIERRSSGEEIVMLGDQPLLREGGVVLARSSSPAATEASPLQPDRDKSPPRLNFQRARDRLLARSPLSRREIAAQTLIRLERRRDPFVRLFVPEVPARESRLTFHLAAERDRYVFTTVRPNSNLDRAGVGPGDILLEMQGQPMTSRTPTEVLRQLEPSENVRLSILNVAGEREEIEVPRREQDLQIVSSVAMTVNRVPIGLLRIQTFADPRVCDLVYEQLRSLRNKKVRALVYDLRDNPGGLVAQAQCVLGLHLGRARYLWRQRLAEDASGYDQVRESSAVVDLFTKRRRVLDALPTTVLINARSASAAELAAASLQEHEAAWIVGARSFGKGVAQAVLPLVEGYPDVKVWKTIARTEQRAGHSVQARGVTPDFPVKTVLGGVHDAEASEERRFDTASDEVFGPSRADYRRPLARAVRHALVHRCVRRRRLTPDTSTTARWLRDHQLRAGVAVVLCDK